MAERITVNSKKPVSIKENLISHKRKTDFRSNSSPVNRILHLQRTIGNQAVQRMVRSGTLQAKLKIGQPGDVYEQEADRVADAVMRMPEPGVQRQVEPEEEEEETLQPKPLAGQITPLVHLQRQEKTEEEEEKLQAKPLAEEITPLVQRQVEPEEEEEEETLNAKPLAKEITPLVQRQVEPEEEEEEEEEIRPKSLDAAAPEVTPEMGRDIQSIKGAGQPLSASERAFFEPRFGADFGNVRVHSDARAAHVARSINAHAFTFGRDVVFGAGHYSPGTSSGRKLLAHELTHVVQQGKVGRGAHMPNNIRSRSPASSDAVHRHISKTDYHNSYYANVNMDKGPYIISALNAQVYAIWYLDSGEKYSIYATASQYPPTPYRLGINPTAHTLANERRGGYGRSRFRVKSTYFANTNTKFGSVNIQVYEKGLLWDTRILKPGLHFKTEAPFVVTGNTKAWPITVEDVSPQILQIPIAEGTEETLGQTVTLTKTQGFALTKHKSTTNTLGSSITSSIGVPDVASIGSKINAERAITNAVTVNTNVRYSEQVTLSSTVKLKGPGTYRIYPIAKVWETPITLNTFHPLTGKKTGTKNAAIYTVKYTGAFGTEKVK